MNICFSLSSKIFFNYLLYSRKYQKHTSNSISFIEDLEIVSARKANDIKKGMYFSACLRNERWTGELKFKNNCV